MRALKRGTPEGQKAKGRSTDVCWISALAATWKIPLYIPAVGFVCVKIQKSDGPLENRQE